jgi:hypothetical protein
MKVLLAVIAASAACGDNISPESRIVGTVWSDDNRNGVVDPGEAPVAGITVFVNLDADPSISGVDPTATTDEAGVFELTVPGPGTYEVRPVLQFGHRYPAVASKRSAASGRSLGIIGGTDTTAGQYGFMVALGQRFDESVFPFCGGVLVTDRHVVTAAHCSAGAPVDEVAIIVGALDPFVDGQIFEVQQINWHPDYNFAAEDGFDIAVWTLAKPVSLDGLSTVEMLSGDAVSLTAPGTLSTTLGWGVSDRPSTLLQQVHLPLVTDAACAMTYPESNRLETQICAGASEGGIDSCQGDSGGPLLVRDPARQVWMHAGITSYGDGCALPNTPGVYARVSALSAWVKTIAVERSGSQSVTVSDIGGVVTANFPTTATTRPQVGPIADRWQLTGLKFPDTVAANTPVAAAWSILGDAPSLTGFTCRFEADLAAAPAAQDVACSLGATTLPLPGYPTGIFATRLTVVRDDVTFTRRMDLVSGAPTHVDLAGALEAQDNLDPDYPFAPYHIDYFDVTGLGGTRAFAVEAASDGQFSMFLTLYDLDQRDFVNGGGALVTGTTKNGAERIVVVPEPGRRYLVGVSSFEQAALGAYTISILNDGTLSPH